MPSGKHTDTEAIGARRVNPAGEAGAPVRKDFYNRGVQENLQLQRFILGERERSPLRSALHIRAQAGAFTFYKELSGSPVVRD